MTPVKHSSSKPSPSASLSRRRRISARQALLPLPENAKPIKQDQSKLIFQIKSELQRLQTRDREWKVMFQMLSHDLKEPILTLEGFSKLLSETSLTKDQSRYLNVLRDAVNTLHQLVGSLQSVAKLSQDPQEFSEVSLNELLQSVLLNLSNQIAHTHGVITLPNKDLTLKTDPIRLFQILMNLIGNSLKFHKKGEIPKIRIAYKRKADAIHISIVDNGIGITSKDLERIFVPFTRLKDVPTEGMGLGLSIVKRIAESFGGSIEAKSKPGIGTTFTLLIPRVLDKRSPSEREVL